MDAPRGYAFVEFEKEEALRRSEQKLEEDAIRFDTFLKENDKRCDLGVPSCRGAFTPSTRLVTISR